MKRTNTPKELGILLDLDGTIVNSMFLMKDAFLSASSRVGVAINEDQQRRVGQALREIMKGRVTRLSEFRLIWRIGKILGLSWWKRTMLLSVAYPKLRRTARSAPPFEGVTETIRRLKENSSIKLALVTSRSRKDAIDKLHSIGILDKFDAVVTREDVRNFKPSPEQVKLAAEIMKLPVSRCVLVGDMPTDIEAAKSAGAFCAAVATGIFPEELKSEQPDLMIRSLADLPSLLTEILEMLDR